MKIAVLVLLSVFAAACVQQDFSTFSRDSFSIDYPSGWSLEEDASPYIDVFFSDGPASFSVSLSGDSLHEAVGRANATQDLLFGYRILEEDSTGNSFMRTYEWTDRAHDATITQTQVWIEHGDILYALTATSPSGDYGDYEDTFSIMIGSFSAG